jgi:hypothetical protein
LNYGAIIQQVLFSNWGYLWKSDASVDLATVLPEAEAKLVFENWSLKLTSMLQWVTLIKADDKRGQC